MESYPAIIATEKGAPAQLSEVPESALPEGDVTVDVHWSSLNYKDGLAVTGTGPVIRTFPMVCGIDLAGTVAFYARGMPATAEILGALTV